MPRLTFDSGTLLLRGVSRRSMSRFSQASQFSPASDGVWDPRVGAWRCDAMHYASIAQQLRQRRFRLIDEVPRWRPVRWPHAALPALRPDQQSAVDAWLAGQCGSIVMPTGTGKTEVALAIIHRTALSTLIVAPVRDLMYQWHRRVRQRLGYESGILGDNVFRPRRVTVTTYDSACIHADKFGDRFALLVFDECHHLPGPMRRDAARMSAAPFRLGLTATLHRADGLHADLDQLIGPVVYEMPIAAARGRTLADYDVIRIPVHLSDSEQRRYDLLARTVQRYMFQRRSESPTFGWPDLCRESGSEPQARKAQAAFYAKKSIEDRAQEKLRVLEDLFRLHAGEPCIVFAGSNAMARQVSLRFLIPCLLNHCGRRERCEVLEGLESGRYPALVANQVLDEGVDLPEVKVAIVIGGSSSVRQAKQRLGRVLRQRGNRRACLYEIVTADTREVHRSRQRRASDAYQGTVLRRTRAKAKRNSMLKGEG